MGDRFVGNSATGPASARTKKVPVEEEERRASAAGEGESDCSVPLAATPLPALDPSSRGLGVPRSTGVCRAQSAALCRDNCKRRVGVLLGISDKAFFRRDRRVVQFLSFFLVFHLVALSLSLHRVFASTLLLYGLDSP